MKRILILFCLAGTISLSAQDRNRNVGGQFSLGVRHVTSLFSDAGSGIGNGVGEQFRIRFYDFLNSEWFADYINSSIGTLGTRTDYHIGWSVMFYFPHDMKYTPYKPIPYFLAGHCFDYTRIDGNNLYANNTLHTDAYSSASRWSSAVQAGFGFHIPFTEKIDLSLSAQYMIHLGKEITTDTRYAGPNNTDPFLYIQKQNSTGLEGHLLVALSLNIRIADLWHDKKGALGNGPHIQQDDQQQPNQFPQN